MTPIKHTDLHFDNCTSSYRGKVRDVYYFGNRMAVVTTDRISAFDVILPKAIPYKGQVLNQVAAMFLDMTADIVDNWVETVPHPNVSFGIRCQPFKVEMVIRGYLAGHAWREYKAGKRSICGIRLPEGLRENDRLPAPIITPATKAESGHDEDISKDEIISQGLIPAHVYEKLEHYTYRLFQRGTEKAAEKGLILVDTKYEFGEKEGSIYLIDEIHTPDSSRYFYADGYEERQEKGELQKQLSKEFVRQWLIENGFQGKEGQKVPEMPDELVENISNRYIELYQTLTGKTFEKNRQYTNNDIENAIKKVLGC